MHNKLEPYLQQAVTIDQQVSRFDVPVQDPSRVQVLQTWENNIVSYFSGIFTSQNLKSGTVQDMVLGVKLPGDHQIVLCTLMNQDILTLVCS